MTTVTIPLERYPNQTVSVMLNSVRWTINLTTRLHRLFASVTNEADGVIVHNRLCLNKVPITDNLVFIDIDGEQNPDYTGLNSRFFLVWTDEP